MNPAHMPRPFAPEHNEPQYTADELIALMVAEGDLCERSKIATLLRCRLAIDEYGTKVATVLALGKSQPVRNDIERMFERGQA